MNLQEEVKYLRKDYNCLNFVKYLKDLSRHSVSNIENLKNSLDSLACFHLYRPSPSKLEAFQFESDWQYRSSFRTQPCFEVSSDLWVKLKNIYSSTFDEQGCLLVIGLKLTLKSKITRIPNIYKHIISRYKRISRVPNQKFIVWR